MRNARIATICHNDVIDKGRVYLRIFKKLLRAAKICAKENDELMELVVVDLDSCTSNQV